MEIVHCLTLSIREDRLLAASKEAKAQGFPIMFHEGEYAPERKDTMKAICRSHKSIIRYAKDNNLNSITICEDDIFFYGEGAFKYYVDNRPTNYDLYFGCIYSGEVRDNRVLNGASGVMTIYTVPSHMYSFLLNEIPDNSHIDREIGNYCHKYNFLMCPLIIAGQRPGYSDNLKHKHNGYEVYLTDRKVYGRDELITP